jgi:hypothetical protein
VGDVAEDSLIGFLEGFEDLGVGLEQDKFESRIHFDVFRRYWFTSDELAHGIMT